MIEDDGIELNDEDLIKAVSPGYQYLGVWKILKSKVKHH